METYNFMDDADITLEELNAIPAELALTGVQAPVPLTAADSYSTSDLNRLRAEIVTAGVQSGCTPKRVNDKLVIGEGTCYFGDGSMLEIFSGGTELAYTPLMENYVYLKRDAANNFIGPVISLKEQTENVIPICRVKADGSVQDTRVWCRAKFPMPDSSFIQHTPVEVRGTVKLDIPLTSQYFRYVMLVGKGIFVFWTRGDILHYYATNRQQTISYARVFYNSYLSDGWFSSEENILTLNVRGIYGETHTLDLYII